MAYIGRQAMKNLYYHRQYQKAKNAYFNAIKHAKTNHWNLFLEKQNPKSIFKAISYTKDILA